MTELNNTNLGPYQITELIRHGGMASVHKAYQPSLDRFVAVKVLFHSGDPQFAVRFKREARAVAQLQHPNIVQIYDYGEQESLLYLAMQYIENGRALNDMMGQPMPPVRALQLIIRVLDALAYAHDRGIIHRDIKPANILMPAPTWPMLADFGIARLGGDNNHNTHLTLPGTAIGTPAYMAPEQAAGDSVDARSDLYALGVVLYELVTGRVPFNATTPMVVMLKHIYEPPPAPRSLNPSLPALVETAVLRALAKEPLQRYQSAAEMSEALERLIEQLNRPTAQVVLGSLHDSAGSLRLSHKRAQLMLDDTVASPSHAGETRDAIAPADDQVTRLSALDHTQTVQAGSTKSQRKAAQKADIDATLRHLVVAGLIRSGRKVVSLLAVVAAMILLVGSGSALAMRPIPTPALPSATAATTLLVVTTTATTTPTDVPTATATPTATRIATATPTPTATASDTPTATSTPTAMPSPTATPRPKPRPKPTEIPPQPTETPPPPAPTEALPAPTEVPPPPTETPRKERRRDNPPPKPPAP